MAKIPRNDNVKYIYVIAKELDHQVPVAISTLKQKKENNIEAKIYR